MNSYFFWGMTSDKEKADEVWQTLHEYFEKLASEDDDVEEETVEGTGATK